jgi:hypothetical protein
MEEIRPTAIRYIKLGARGAWEAGLDLGQVGWGLPTDPHDLALACDWQGVHDTYRTAGAAQGTATGYTNEARSFYDGDRNALWITFARGRMWWTFAEPDVHWSGGDGASAPTRFRTACGGWSDRDIAGARLDLDRLSTRLTQLAGYRRTICTLSAEQRALCLRYINVTADEDQRAVAVAQDDLQRGLTALIRRLSWRDFEELVDLAFQCSGWRRVSALGGTAKDVDLVVEQPLTGARMAVQIKSKADQTTVDDYAMRLGRRPGDEQLMLVCHSPIGNLSEPVVSDGRTLQLMLTEQVSKLAMDAGLVSWISARAQ